MPNLLFEQFYVRIELVKKRNVVGTVPERASVHIGRRGGGGLLSELFLLWSRTALLHFLKDVIPAM